MSEVIRKVHSKELRSAVLDEMAKGASNADLANRFNVSNGVIRAWRKRYGEEVRQKTAIRAVTIGSLLPEPKSEPVIEKDPTEIFSQLLGRNRVALEILIDRILLQRERRTPAHVLISEATQGALGYLRDALDDPDLDINTARTAMQYAIAELERYEW